MIEWDSHFGNRNDLPSALTETLDALMPAMVIDGGGFEVLRYAEGVLELRLVGSCTFCPSQQLSISAMQQRIKASIPEIKIIVSH